MGEERERERDNELYRWLRLSLHVTEVNRMIIEISGLRFNYKYTQLLHIFNAL